MATVSRVAVRHLSTAVATSLTYPVRPPNGYQNGRVVTSGHWDKIASIFPQEPWTGDDQLLHDEEQPVKIQVNDARTAGKTLSVSSNGFELVKWPTCVADFHNNEEIRTNYYKDTEELVKATTGAKDVFVFQHMRRDGTLHNNESDTAKNPDTAPAHGAVQRVHADYTPDNGPMKLRELEEAGLVPKGLVADRPWSICNVWRSTDTENPIQALPLAVLDTSTVSADDTFTYALVTNHTSPPLVGFNNGVSFNPKHEWYYYSHMTHDEALLFYTYDDSFQTANPRFVFHSAINTGATGPPRKSIECRCLVVF